jgi:hypothetical protein
VSQGEANTNLLAPLVNADSPYSAALVCANLNFAGQGDWYLPSLNEGAVFAAACGLLPDSGCTDSNGYWTSTQHSSFHSRSFQFNNNYGFSDKTFSYRIRCARKD